MTATAVSEKAAPAATAAPHVQMVPVDRLFPSPTNPRRTFRNIDEMAASIRANLDRGIPGGILVPVLARPRFDGKPGDLEMIAGERRWRGAKEAGIKGLEVPVIVRDVKDQEVVVLQQVENLQREDLNALEEANGYVQLEQAGMDAHAIAKAIGKSPGYVYARLKLLALDPVVKEFLAAGWISPGHAVLIARLNIGQQLLALQECFARGYVGFDPADLDTRRRRLKVIAEDETKALQMSEKGLRNYIAVHFSCDLAVAPWDLKDAHLIEAAGACVSCPKRARNRPELHPDLVARGKDLCADGECYARKRKQFIEIQVGKATAQASREQLGQKGALRLDSGGHLRGPEDEKPDRGTIAAGDYRVAKPGSCKHAKVGVVMTTGAIEHVCVTKDCAKHWPERQRRQPSPDEEKERQDELVNLALMRAVLAKVNAVDGRVIDTVLRFLALTLNSYADPSAAALGVLAETMGWPKPPGNDFPYDYVATALKKAGKLKAPAQAKLAIACVLADDADIASGGDRIRAAAAAFKVDVTKVRREVVAGLKPKAAAAGTCRYCRCTMKHACHLGGKKTCSWADATKTLCTNPECLKQASREAKAKAAAGGAR